jgi:hypothetical protein
VSRVSFLAGEAKRQGEIERGSLGWSEAESSASVVCVYVCWELLVRRLRSGNPVSQPVNTCDLTGLMPDISST